MAPKLYMVEASAVVRSVLLTEAAIGISLDYVDVDLFKGEHLTAEFLKLNPLHTVPTLVDEGKAIFESAAINIYLVEKYAKDKSFYPNDPYEKALVNEILHFCSSVFFPTSAKIIKPIMVMGAKKINPEDVNSIEVYGMLEKLLEGRVWAIGDKVTLADFAVIPIITGCEVVAPVDGKRFPNIVRYMEKVKHLPYYHRTQKGDDMFKKEFLARLNN